MSEAKCRRTVTDRCERFCERCCRFSALTMHHRLKRSHGGLWVPENIVAVCGSGTTGCHGWIEHHPDEAETQGWHVRPWNDPATTPVLWRGNEWSLLLADGGRERVQKD